MAKENLKGRMVFSGPGNKRDARRTTVIRTEIGIGKISPFYRSESGYLFKTTQEIPFGKPSSCWPGEIGWWYFNENISPDLLQSVLSKRKSK